MDADLKSVITSEVEIKGVIKSSGSVRLDGKLEGDLICEGDAFIGSSANIKGTIAANSVTVEGHIAGTITARDKIEMKSTAHIIGDIKSKRLSVEDGVTFIGKSEVNPSGETISTQSGAPSKQDFKFEDPRSMFASKGKPTPFPGV
ncbi:MAG: polymer-forming cytoskeletal protein [Lentisphaerota bacterium]